MIRRMTKTNNYKICAIDVALDTIVKYVKLTRPQISEVWKNSEHMQSMLLKDTWVELQHSTTETLDQEVPSIYREYCAAATKLASTNQLGRVLFYNDVTSKLYIKPIVGKPYLVDITIELDYICIYPKNEQHDRELNRLNYGTFYFNIP